MFTRAARKLYSLSRWITISAILILIVSWVSNITGASDITAAGASSATLRLTIPLLMAGLGGLWAERSGVINIGLEGMMIAGTWTGAWFGYKHGWVVGFIAAAIVGSLIGLMHAVLTVKVGIDQAVSGLAINLLAFGSARYLSGVYFVSAGGDSNVSPPVQQPPVVMNLLIGQTLLDLHNKHIFFISDVAGLVGGLFTNLSVMTIFLLLGVPITSFIMWRTRFGLRMRFCGENPVAAESLGVNVYRTRYIALAVSGLFAAMGGAYLSVVSSAVYREGQTAGRGFIGLATVIFGNWKPGGVFAGSLLFGFTDALRMRQADSVHAVLLAVAIISVLIAAFMVYQKKFKGTLIALAVAALTYISYIQVKVVPDEFVTVFPNVATLLVLTFLSQRLRPPAMAGAPYRKGEEAH